MPDDSAVKISNSESLNTDLILAQNENEGEIKKSKT